MLKEVDVEDSLLSGLFAVITSKVTALSPALESVTNCFKFANLSPIPISTAPVSAYVS